MSGPPALASRLRYALLLACLPLTPAGSPDGHSGHGADTAIFTDARHAGQAEHWEAADSVRLRRCPACLAPARVAGLLPRRAVSHKRAAATTAPAQAQADPAAPELAGSARPRAPPSS